LPDNVPGAAGRRKRDPGDGIAQFAAVLAGRLALLLNAHALPPAQLAAAGFYVAVSLAGGRGVFEAEDVGGPIETARLGWAGRRVRRAGSERRSTRGRGVVGAVAFASASLAWFLPRPGALTETELAPIM
jgi:hypothetical protein